MQAVWCTWQSAAKRRGKPCGVKAGTVLAVGLIAVGLATALYPFASQWISQSSQQQLIYAQQQLAGQDALEQQMQLAQDYNQRALPEQRLCPRPF